MQGNEMTREELAAVAAHFRIQGEVTEGRPYGTGHINDTFAVVCEGAGPGRRYILQRINHRIFKNVPALMHNIRRVTEHIRAKLRTVPGADVERGTLTVVPTREDQPCCETAEGEFWRCYVFIEGARTYDVLVRNEQAYEAGAAFARFQKMLADLPAPPLHETIPDFHNTPARFATLRTAIREDVCGRAASCRPEVDFALAREAMTRLVTDGLAAGEIPERVTHNDTKINNVMLDDETGRGVCVIDLDTVMPGSVLYDFGDEVRTTVGHFAENEKDLSKVYVDLERFRSLVTGYLSVADDFLVPRERELLVESGRLITFEIGIRFLADYLQGDVYFKTSRENENLDRARTQFALVRDLEAKADEMRAIARQGANAGAA